MILNNKNNSKSLTQLLFIQKSNYVELKWEDLIFGQKNVQCLFECICLQDIWTSFNDRDCGNCSMVIVFLS